MVWTNILSINVCETYSQRANACFAQLDAQGKGSFSLKEFTSHGSFVLHSLGLHPTNDQKTVVLIDVFRMFDRSGDGTVDVNEFVCGIIAQLQQMKHLAEWASIVEEILSLHDHATLDVGAFIELLVDVHDHAIDIIPSYWQRFYIFNYIMIECLRQRPTFALVDDLLVATSIRNCLDIASAELLEYFHISQSVYKHLLYDDADVRSIESCTLDRSVDWNPVVLIERDELMTDFVESGVGVRRLQPGDVRKSSSSSRLNDSVCFNSAIEEENKSKSAQQIENSIKKALDFLDHQAASRTVPMTDKKLPPSQAIDCQGNAEEDELYKGRLDYYQLFLLQTALRSIDNFFNLVVPVLPAATATAGAGAERLSTTSIVDIFNPVSSTQTASKYLQSDGAPEHDSARAVGHKSSDKSALSQSPADQTMRADNQVLHDLLLAQDKLRRVTMRLEILETAQQNQQCGWSSADLGHEGPDEGQQEVSFAAVAGPVSSNSTRSALLSSALQAVRGASASSSVSQSDALAPATATATVAATPAVSITGMGITVTAPVVKSVSEPALATNGSEQTDQQPAVQSSQSQQPRAKWQILKAHVSSGRAVALPHLSRPLTEHDDLDNTSLDNHDNTLTRPAVANLPASLNSTSSSSSCATISPVAAPLMTAPVTETLSAMRPVPFPRQEDGGSHAFADIMAEISDLRGCLAERGAASSTLGCLLDSSCVVACMPLVSAGADSNPTRTSHTEQSDDDGHCIDLQSPELTKPSSRTEANNPLVDLMGEITLAVDQLQLLAQARLQDHLNHEQLSELVVQQAEELAERRCAAEAQAQERNELLAGSIELQILRDKVTRLQQQASTAKKMQLRNVDLSRNVRELESQVHDLLTLKSATGSNSSSSSNDAAMAELQKCNQELESKLSSLQAQYDEVFVEKNRLLNDNTRLTHNLSVSEQRVKTTLRDQFALQQHMHSAEDELAGGRAFIAKLLAELDVEKAQVRPLEEAARKINEHQLEIVRLQAEVIVAREEAALAKKYKQDLASAQGIIESIENKLAELMTDSERGAVAIEQLDNYSQQLRVKTKENRELQLQLHSLESQLKSTQQLQVKYRATTEELQDCKIRVEKIPGLLAELARIRGSSRACMKAVTEQDKQLAQYKVTVKQLEKTNTRLKADNRSMQDVEGRLKEAGAEIARLMTMVGEVNDLKAGVKNAEEERRSMEGQYKKMRKYVRQSMITPLSNDSPGAGAPVSADQSNPSNPNNTDNNSPIQVIEIVAEEDEGKSNENKVNNGNNMGAPTVSAPVSSNKASAPPAADEASHAQSVAVTAGGKSVKAKGGPGGPGVLALAAGLADELARSKAAKTSSSTTLSASPSSGSVSSAAPVVEALQHAVLSRPTLQRKKSITQF